jgi:hypothetical protein
VRFHIETLNNQGQPTKRRVGLTITGIQADGKIAKYMDHETGVLVPGPQITFPTTPSYYDFTFGPGIVSASVLVDYLGVKGDIVQCYVTAGALELDRDVDQVRTVGPNGRGAARASCVANGP